MTELERDLLAALELALAHIDDMEGPVIIKEDIRLALRQMVKRAKAAPAGAEADNLRAEVARLHAECDRLTLALGNRLELGTSSTGIETESATSARAALRARSAPAAGDDKHAKFLADLAQALGRAPYELDEALALEQVRGMVSKAEQAQALEDELEAKMSRLELAIEKARIILEKAE